MGIPDSTQYSAGVGPSSSGVRSQVAAARRIEPAAIDGPLRRAVLHDMLRRHAARSPGHPAIIERTADGARVETSYGELDRSANRVASAWLASGISPGAVIAAVAAGSTEFVVAYYAALRCGATFTAFNPLGTPDELAYQIDHARPSLLLVGSEQSDRVEALRSTGSPVPRTVPMQDIVTSAGTDGTEAHVPSHEHDIAMLVYTSGTESRPKGVMLTHRAFLVSTTFSWVLEGYLRPSDRFLLLAPLHTMAGLGSITNIITTGATMVLARPDPAVVLRVIEEEHVTNMSQTPTFYRRLADFPSFDGGRLASLEQCHTYGGLAQPRIFERISSAVPGMSWATYWGQSELSQLGSIGWFRTVADIPGGDPRWIGRPVPHLDIRVVDEEDRDVEEGELIVRSPAVMAGYLDNPTATAATLRDGWLRTGDIVAIDARRNLFFVDRRKDMVKTGGMNVSSLEIELVLSAHPSVAEVAVVGLPDEEWSEVVAAFVVLTPGFEGDPDELRLHCRASLAPYKIPKIVRFTPVLPRDTQGKIRKRELRAVGVNP